MEEPNVFGKPPEGNVNEPDLNRLLRSGTEGAAAEVLEWRRAGREDVARAAVGTKDLCDCSNRDSVEGGVLPRVLDAAANRWAASCTLEGRVPALARRNPGG